MHAIEGHDDPERDLSNDYSSTSYFPQFIHRQDTKRLTPTVIPFAAQLQGLSHQLATSLEILSPCRLRCFQLRKPLKNYHFERHEKRNESENLAVFGVRHEEILREQNLLILTLASLMREFRASKEKAFYIATKKGDRVFSFYHEDKHAVIESILSITGFSEMIGPELDKDGIPFRKVQHPEHEIIQIRNKAISIYWGKLVNKILQNDKSYRSFQVVANFPFLNGFEALPIESFNGSETKKEHSPFASEKSSIIGETLFEQFRLKMEGLWTVENLRELDVHLTQTFGECKFDVSIGFHPCAKPDP